ncbi:MAG: alpha/beta hydrolase [Methanosarcinaceae archaeon]|nr:alpha/beta hydrolase [Methanosarcinaceae archaeon]
MENPRKYGRPPFSVAVIHGGPGAAGELAPMARELTHECGILEPIQTLASIDGQIHELQAILEKHGDFPVKLVGHSWGAWLSFIFAAHHPRYVRKLIIIGSGPFEQKYAPRIMETRLIRLGEEKISKLYALNEALNDPDANNRNAIFAKFDELMFKVDSFNPLPLHAEYMDFNYDIFQCVWNEANKLRQSDKLLKLGKHILCPVVAVHGDYDPHPFEGVEKPLFHVLNDFRTILLKNCGHYPWLEQNAREMFFEILKEELSEGNDE